jgi:hypothetical protein
MTVKMVVPTAGNLLWMGGVRGTRDVMVNAEILNQLGTELKICPSKSLRWTELKICPSKSLRWTELKVCPAL